MEDLQALYDQARKKRTTMPVEQDNDLQSLYERARTRAATTDVKPLIESVTKPETATIKNLGKAIGTALLDNYKQAQEEKASPNSVVRKPFELPTMGLTKIQQDQAAKAKADEPDVVTLPHEARKLVQDNTSPRLPYQNPEADKMKQTLTDVKAIVPGVNVNRDLLKQIGNTANVDAYLKQRDAEREGAPKLLQEFAGGIDRFLYKNPVGKQIMGFSQGAGQTAGAVDESQPKVGSSTSRALGAVAGAVAAPIGNEGNLVGALPGLPRAAGAAAATAEEAKQPSSANWYTRMFGNQGVGITAGDFHNRTGTGIQIVDSPIKRTASDLVSTAKTAGRNTYQTLVDSLSPIKNTFGQKAYDVAMDANRSGNLANTIINDKFVDMEGNVLGKGMAEIFKQVPRGLDNDAVDYLVLRDAKARVARGEKVYEDRLGMNDVGKIQARIDQYEARHPEFKNLGTDWDGFTKNLRQVYGLDSGLLNAKQVEAMEAARPNYTPMRRQFSSSERVKQAFMRSNNGFSGQKAPINAVSKTGSVRKIVDPRKTMMEATQKWVQNSMNNRVMQYIGDSVMENPEAFKEVAEIQRTPTKNSATLARAYADADELAEAAANGNEEEFLDDLSKQFRKLFDKAKAGDDTVVTYMKNGQPVAIRIKDMEALRALASLGPQQTGVIVRALGFLSNLTKRSATGPLAPLFAVRQLTSDITQSLIQSPNAMAHLGDYAHALVSSIVEAIPGLKDTKLAALAADYNRTGGAYSSLLKTEKGVSKSMRKLRRDAILSPRGIAQGVTTTVGAPFRTLEKVGDIAENLNRMAAFKGSLRTAGNVRTPDSVRNAMNAAREITTNYSRKGTLAQELESAIPYNNAAVQGLRRFLVTYKKHPLKASIGTLALAITPKMLEYAAFGNDPDYQRIPARDRYRKLFISKRPDGSFVSLQMSPEYNAIGALTEDLMRRYIGNDPEAMKGVADALMNAYTPPTVSGLAQGATQGGGIEQSGWGLANSLSVGPLVGTLANQSFTGSPIVPKSMEENSPRLQYDEKTTAVAKKIGEVMGWSPKKIDYLIRQYSGDIGRYILPFTSTTGSADVQKTLAKNFITDPIYTNTLTDDYYRVKDLVSRVEADGKVTEKYPKWYSEDIHKLLTSTAKGTPGAQLKQLNADKRAINADTKMSNKDKANKLRDIQVQLNSVYTDILSRAEDAGVPIKGR